MTGNATILYLCAVKEDCDVASLNLVGHRLIHAATVDDALNPGGERPDLIIVDLDAPDQPIAEVCRRFQGEPRTVLVPILRIAPGVQGKAGQVPADSDLPGVETEGYLVRPVNADELRTAVRTLLRLKRTDLELGRKSAQLAEADRRKDLFLAMLAHELRNPLAAITSSVEVMRVNPLSDHRRSHYFEILRKQSRHLSNLVGDLLDASRINQGKISVRKKPLELESVLHRVVEAHRPFAECRGQRLTLKLPSGTFPVDGDATRLEQIFSNLIDNAIKYGSIDGEVSVDLATEAGDLNSTVSVTVRDSGIGISSKSLPRIFDLFAQVDESLDRTTGGLGVGLTIVKKLVEAHQGSIAAHSEGLGRGSCFVVTLPLTLGSPSEAKDFVPTEKVFRRRRVLVIEDNIDARESLKDLLLFWGHDVALAADGLAGVQVARQSRPEIALVDVGLPLLDGYEVARELRKLPEGRELFLVALTGYSGPEPMRRSWEAGFDLHLVKPVDPEELSRILNSLPAVARSDA